MKIRFRFCALLLCVCMMFSLTSCGQILVSVLQSLVGLDGETEWQEYTLTEDDVALFYEYLEKCEDRIFNNAGEFRINLALNNLLTQLYYINTQSRVAYILYCMNVSGEKESNDYLFSSAAAEEVYAAYMELCRQIYDSDCDYRDTFFADWGEADIKMMQSYSDEVAQKQTENDALLLEYRDLDEENFDTEIYGLFNRLIANNQEIAKLSGYEDYVTYAYENVYVRDYAPGEIQAFRALVKKEILPLYQLYGERFANGYDQLSEDEKNLLSAIMSEDYDINEDMNYVLEYIDASKSTVSEVMGAALNSNTVIFTDSIHANPGAFTGYLIDYMMPVCYFGPGYQSAFTVVHEMGHYYAMCYNYDATMMMDLSEVHSQANEFLFLAYLETLLEEDVYDVLVDYYLYETMYDIILCTIVDDFEHRMYQSEALEADAVDLVMQTVCAEYNLTEEHEIYQSAMEYWKYVVIETPVYYISYAVSSVASLQIYAKAVQDAEAGIDLYCRLVEDADATLGFCEILKECGLYTPFDAKAYDAIKGIQ